MDPLPKSSGASADQRQATFERLDQARLTLAASLGELLAEGMTTHAEILDAIGFEELERHLPAVHRARILEAAVLAGRRGQVFDDAALLAVVPPHLVALALPLGRLEEVLETLWRGDAPMEQLDDDDLAPQSTARTGFSSEAPPARGAQGEEVDPDAVELLPPSLGEPFADSATESESGRKPVS